MFIKWFDIRVTLDKLAPMNDDTNQPIEASEDVSIQETAPETALKCRLERTLPTARLAFGKQVDILKAYPAAYERVRGPVSIDDLKDFVRLAPATISPSRSDSSSEAPGTAAMWTT